MLVTWTKKGSLIIRLWPDEVNHESNMLINNRPNGGVIKVPRPSRETAVNFSQIGGGLSSAP